MPRRELPRPGKRQVQGKIDSLTLWYFQRGYSAADIVEIVRERFGRQWMQTARRSLSHWANTRLAADVMRSLRPGQTLPDTSTPSRTGRKTALRIYTTVTWFNPREGVNEKRAYIVDVDASKTKREIFQDIRNILHEELVTQYSWRNTRFENNPDRSITRVNIDQIEGF